MNVILVDITENLSTSHEGTWQTRRNCWWYDGGGRCSACKGGQ